MAAVVEIYRDALALMLGGTYDVASASLAISILDDTATLLGIDATGLTYDQSVDAHSLQTVAVSGQSFTWDPSTRASVLVPGSAPTWVPGVLQTFKHAYLYDTANTHPPLALITWPSDQSAASGIAHTITLDALLRFRMWSSSDPAPVGNIFRPVVVTDVNAVNWRLYANTTGPVLNTIITSEFDPNHVYLTSPDLTLWMLKVDIAGVVTTDNTVPFVDGDRVFDNSAFPCLLPSSDPTTQYVLSVDNAGVLSVT